MLQDELGDGALAQRTASPHSSHPSLLLHQLAVDQGHQLPLHGPTEDARAEGGHTCKRGDSTDNRFVQTGIKGQNPADFLVFPSSQSLHYNCLMGLQMAIKVLKQCTLWNTIQEKVQK